MLLILFAPCLAVFAKSKKCETAFDEFGATVMVAYHPYSPTEGRLAHAAARPCRAQLLSITTIGTICR
jgi:hypothetical protein